MFELVGVVHMLMLGLVWFLGFLVLVVCDHFSHKIYDSISYAIVSSVAEETVGRSGIFVLNLHNHSWYPGWEAKVVGA